MTYDEKDAKIEVVRALAYELGGDTKVARIVARKFEQALDAVAALKKNLADIEAALVGDDADKALGTLRQFAGHAGYSGTISANYGELLAAAAGASSLLEAM